MNAINPVSTPKPRPGAKAQDAATHHNALGMLVRKFEQPLIDLQQHVRVVNLCCDGVRAKAQLKEPLTVNQQEALAWIAEKTMVLANSFYDDLFNPEDPR
jgi:hypothetical protein